MTITLADVVAHRHLLLPREAATLTLAVGREWDRQRARHGSLALPDPSAIELTRTGEVAFLTAGGGATRENATLSDLLGELLGVDEEDAPRQRVPGGLLMTLAGRVGSVELPSSHEDGFRSALLRFADDDPDVLVRVFARMAAARAGRVSIGEPLAAAKVRRGPDRRRQPPAVAALRRSVRELERQTFEARAARTRRRRVPLLLQGIPRRRRVAAGLASAVAVLLIAAGILADAVSRPVPTTGHPITQVTAPGPVSAANIEPVAPRETAAAPEPTLTPRPARRKPARVARPETHVDPPHVTFAGGSRSIAWARPGRR